MTTIVRALIAKVEETNPDCECEKYFKHSVFDDVCSECYEKNNPEKYQAFMENQMGKLPDPPFTPKELLDYTDELAIPYDSKYWTVIKHLFTTDSWISDCNLQKFIVHTKMQTTFEGISAEQGAELMALYLKNNHGGSFPGPHATDKKGIMFYKIEHSIAGMIIDRWNIKSILHGGRGYCYYSTHGKRPVNKEKMGLKQLDKPPAFIRKETLQLYQTKWVVRDRIQSWVKNVPLCAVGDFMKTL